LLLINISCNHSDSKAKKSGKKLFERKGELIYLQGSDVPYTGEIKDTLQDRVVDYHVVKGIKDGEFKVFFLNGNPQMDGMIKNGLNEGEWKYYYNDGNIESEGKFKHDTVVGKWQWFYRNGKIKEEGNYTAGQRNGVWKDYNVSGKVADTKKFHNDMVVK
jgi:antitoxin component YwqK of YwqJK toxin-antitoxin module